MSTKNDNSMSVNSSKFKKKKKIKKAKRKNNVLLNLEWFDIDKCLTMNTEGKKKKETKKNIYVSQKDNFLCIS